VHLALAFLFGAMDRQAPQQKCDEWFGALSCTNNGEGMVLPNDGNSYVCELFVRWSSTTAQSSARRRSVMDGIIYLVGLIVIVMFILSFLGLH
jgi:hypothetical protein